uniref:Uncharacterized protein n=1 Tax=Sus scrofa TaxID=9823 RepID=A0A8D1D8T2_PIG
MKEEAFLRRRFSLCPPSSTPQKVDPRKLSRNLLLGGENDLYPLGPGKDMEPNGPSPPRDEGPPTPGSATKVPPVRGPRGRTGVGGTELARWVFHQSRLPGVTWHQEAGPGEGCGRQVAFRDRTSPGAKGGPGALLS